MSGWITQSFFDAERVTVKLFEHLYDARPPIRGIEITVTDKDGNACRISATGVDTTNPPQLDLPTVKRAVTGAGQS